MTASAICSRGLDVDAVDARRRFERDRPGDQRHPRASFGRGGGNREALPARGAVGDHAHRIDRLVRRAGGDEDMLARQASLASRVGPSRSRIASRLGQAARAELAARHLALVGLDHAYAVGLAAARRCAGRGVLPHAHVHRRRDEHRLVGREQQRGREIVGDPRRHLGQQVGGRRADQHEIGRAD